MPKLRVVQNVQRRTRAGQNLGKRGSKARKLRAARIVVSRIQDKRHRKLMRELKTALLRMK